MKEALTFDIQLGKLPMATMNIMVHPMLPIRNPKRSLPAKQWHGHRKCGRYAQRVNKKWLKRYGLSDPIHILRTPQAFFVSQQAYQQIKRLAP